MTPWAPDSAKARYSVLVESYQHTEIIGNGSLRSLVESRSLLDAEPRIARIECEIFVLHRLLHDLSLKSFWSRIQRIARSRDALEHAISAVCHHSLECFRTDLREETFSQRQFEKWKKDVAATAAKLAQLLNNTLLDDSFGWWLLDDELERLELSIGGPEGQRALAKRRRNLPKGEEYLLDTRNLLTNADLPLHTEQLRRLAESAAAHSEANYGGNLPSKPLSKNVQVHKFVTSITWYMRAKFGTDERGLVSDVTNSLFGTKYDRKAIREVTGSIPEELMNSRKQQ